MKKTIALLAALALTPMAACTSLSAESGLPPMRYRSDVTLMVAYVTDVETACAAAGLKAVEGLKTKACTVISRDAPPRMILPNPCLGGNREACHEIGHVNGWGWGGDHED